MKGIISAQIVQDRNYAASNKGKDEGEQQSFLIHCYIYLIQSNLSTMATLRKWLLWGGTDVTLHLLFLRGCYLQKLLFCSMQIYNKFIILYEHYRCIIIVRNKQKKRPMMYGLVTFYTAKLGFAYTVHQFLINRLLLRAILAVGTRFSRSCHCG